MSKATIKAALGQGLYSVDLNYNAEVITFNIERLHLRENDILNIDLPQAEANLSDAQSTLSDATNHLNEVINQLAGKPSAALFAALNAVDSALTSAAGFLTNTQTALASAAAFIAIAASSLPLSPDPPSVAAIAFAGSTTGIASGSVNDEQNEVSTAQSQVGTIISELSLTEPDLDQAQIDVAALLTQLDTVIAAHVQASSDINFAQGQTQAARNILPGDTSYDASRAALDSALLSFATATADHTAANGQYVIAQDQTGQAQVLLTPGRDDSKKAVKEASKALNDAQTARTLAQFAVDSLSLEFQELERKIRELDAIAKRQIGQLWCADLTEDLPAGAVVGTMEIPGELGLPASGIGAAVIRPAFDHTHLWNFQRDGWLTPCQAQTPAATFYNLAMMPGWQVFRPTFRFARVLKINDDGSLKIGLIAPNVSSQQAIDVTPVDLPLSPNQSPQAVNYDSVPVTYMDCGALAFTVGDEVVVSYTNQDATKPRVIGFRDNPQPCVQYFFSPQGKLQVVKSGDDDAWVFQAETGLLFGNRDWRGALSWWSIREDGGDGIEETAFFWRDIALDPTHPRDTSKLYYRGKVLATAPGPILGASYSGGTIVVVIWSDPNIQVYSSEAPFAAWNLLHSLEVVNPFGKPGIWDFSPDGKSACSVMYGADIEIPNFVPHLFSYSLTAGFVDQGRQGGFSDGGSVNRLLIRAKINNDGTFKRVFAVSTVDISYLEIDGESNLSVLDSPGTDRYRGTAYIDLRPEQAVLAGRTFMLGAPPTAAYWRVRTKGVVTELGNFVQADGNFTTDDPLADETAIATDKLGNIIIADGKSLQNLMVRDGNFQALTGAIAYEPHIGRGTK